MEMKLESVAIKLYAPDPLFTGKVCGMDFRDGVGVCDSEFVAGFLCAKGFALVPGESMAAVPAEVAPPVLPDTSELEAMPIDDLVKLAHQLGVSLSGIRHGDKKAIVERLTAGGA